jgi:hypothetical protein
MRATNDTGICPFVPGLKFTSGAGCRQLALVDFANSHADNQQAPVALVRSGWQRGM